MVLLLVSMITAQVGCSKDTDCKGERICEAGRCVDPAPQAPEPPAPTPPTARPPPLVPATTPESEYPKVVRGNGRVCVQSLDDRGAVTQSCRAETPSPASTSMDTEYDAPPPPPPRSQRRARTPEREREWSRFVMDLSFNGGGVAGVTNSGSGFLGRVGASLFLGGRFVESFGLGVTVDEALLFGPGGFGSVTTLGPGFRFGTRVHATLTPGAAIVAGARVVGVAYAMLLHFTIPLAGGFGLHLQTGFILDASGVLIPLSLGLGGSQF